MTLVLLHALGTDRHMWDPVLPFLEGEDVLALDMPGFGDAPPLATAGNGGGSVAARGNGAAPGNGATPANGAARGNGAAPGNGAERGNGAAARDGITPRELAAAIHADLLERGIERPDVAGNSLGGWVALELAHAGWARSVTAIAPAGLWPQPLAPKRATARAVARTLSPALPVLLRSERGRRAALSGTIVHPERVPYAAALALVRAYADAPGFDAVNAGMRANRFTGLDEVDVPLTLAWPEFDRLVERPAHVPASAQEFFLEGCGHMPTYDDPEAVARVLRAGAALS